MVTLSSPAPGGGFAVSLLDNSSNVTVPESVTVATGFRSAQFTATVSSVTADRTVVISASAGEVTRTFPLNLVVPAQLSGLSCTPGTLGTWQSATCTVMLTKAASSPATVTLSSSQGVLSVPVSVTIGSGSENTKFLAWAGSPAAPLEVALTAFLSSRSVQQTLTVLAVAAPRIKSPLAVGARVAVPVEFNVSVDQPQGLSVNLSVAGLPAGAIFDPTTGRFTWTPNESQTGAFTVTVTALGSSGASATQEILIQVLSDKTGILTARNSADLTFGDFCSPGSWATLLGVDFTAQATILAQGVPLPTNLGGVEVRVNDSPVPLLYAAQSQINFQCPRLPIGSAIQVTVKTETGFTSLPFAGVMREATPALFTLDSSGSGQGAVLIANSYEVAMPRTDGIPSRPVRRGELLSIYANGLGETVEDIPVGFPAPLDHLVRLKGTVRVFFGGVEVAPDFAGLAPGEIGLYQIIVPVAAEVPAGPAVPLRVEVVLVDGSTLSSNEVTIAIE